jgi:hypothetical protein
MHIWTCSYPKFIILNFQNPNNSYEEKQWIKYNIMKEDKKIVKRTYLCSMGHPPNGGATVVGRPGPD